MEQIINRVKEFFSLERIINFISDGIPSLIITIIVLIILLITWKVIKWILKSIYNRMSLDKTLQNMISNIVKTVFFTIGIITVLAGFGINIGVLLASIGIAGIALGFAAQDALSNIIAGVFIFWDKPFVIGDLIEVNGQYGRVDVITMRSTRLITVDGKMLSIPNNELINSTVASYTNFPNLRIDIDFTVSPNESLKEIRGLLYDIVKNDDAYLVNPQPEVVLNQLNDYNIQLVFRVWIKDEQDHIFRSDYLREKIFNALTKAQVNMPYETLNVNINKDIK